VWLLSKYSFVKYTIQYWCFFLGLAF
jgi:hypothetical protein